MIKRAICRQQSVQMVVEHLGHFREIGIAQGESRFVPLAEEGFGTRLILNLSRQLGGDCSFRYPPSGLVFHLSMIAPATEPRS